MALKFADPCLDVLRDEVAALARKAASAEGRIRGVLWRAEAAEHDLNRTRLAIKRMRTVRRACLDAWWAAFMIGMLAGTTLLLALR